MTFTKTGTISILWRVASRGEEERRRRRVQKGRKKDAGEGFRRGGRNKKEKGRLGAVSATKKERAVAARAVDWY
jgi:hypothetical protein